MQRSLAGRAATIGAGIPSGRGLAQCMVIETSMERYGKVRQEVSKMFAENSLILW